MPEVNTSEALAGGKDGTDEGKKGKRRKVTLRFKCARCYYTADSAAMSGYCMIGASVSNIGHSIRLGAGRRGIEA